MVLCISWKSMIKTFHSGLTQTVLHPGEQSSTWITHQPSFLCLNLSLSFFSSVHQFKPPVCLIHFLFLILLFFSFTLPLAFFLQNQYPAVKCSEPQGGGCCCGGQWKWCVLQGSPTDIESRTVPGLDLPPLSHSLSLSPLQEGSISEWGVKFQLAGASRSFGPAEWWSMLAPLGAFQSWKEQELGSSYNKQLNNI